MLERQLLYRTQLQGNKRTAIGVLFEPPFVLVQLIVMALHFSFFSLMRSL